MATYTITEAQRMRLIDWLKGTNNFYMRAATTLLQSLEPALAQQGEQKTMTDAEYQHMTANGAAAWAGVDPQELRTGAVLTDAEIIAIAERTKTAEPGRDGYVLPISFAKEILAAQQSAEPARPDYYMHENDEDTWREFPDDCDVIESGGYQLKIWDEYECEVAWRGKQRFRVTKVPDESNDDYVVELVRSSRTLYESKGAKP